jgi:hypothetical protein
MLSIAIIIDATVFVWLADWLAPRNQQRPPASGRAVEKSRVDLQFQTSHWCCTYMASPLPQDCRTVLEPTPGAGNLVAALGDRDITTPAGDFWQEIAPRNLWLDCVAMNPPFSLPLLGYQILLRCKAMTNHIIALMPWLTIINSARRTKLIRDYGLVSVTHLPRSTFPGTRVQCCILQMCRGFLGVTALRFI